MPGFPGSYGLYTEISPDGSRIALGSACLVVGLKESADMLVVLDIETGRKTFGIKEIPLGLSMASSDMRPALSNSGATFTVTTVTVLTTAGLTSMPSPATNEMLRGVSPGLWARLS